MYKRIEDVPIGKWQKLSKKKIYFGHQSVGFNIIDGINELIQQYPQIELHFLEGRHFNNNKGIFLHSRIGKNRDPDLKVKDFVNVIDDELGATPDIAALKFCYVDAYDNVNVHAIFQEYKQAMEQLKREHPDITIIHFTMPLRTQPVTWKTKLKLLLGREPWELRDNIKRNQFNELLLKEYEGKEPVFDIARYESTAFDGTPNTFQVKGREYRAMLPEYSSDGGHLNDKGKIWIAQKFLLFLVSLE